MSFIRSERSMRHGTLTSFSFPFLVHIGLYDHFSSIFLSVLRRVKGYFYVQAK